MGSWASAETALIASDDKERRRHDGYASLGGSVAIGQENQALSGDRHALAGVLLRINGDSDDYRSRLMVSDRYL